MTNWKTTEEWDEKEIQALFDAINSLDTVPVIQAEEVDDIFLSPEEIEAILGEIEDEDPFNHI